MQSIDVNALNRCLQQVDNILSVIWLLTFLNQSLCHRFSSLIKEWWWCPSKQSETKQFSYAALAQYRYTHVKMYLCSYKIYCYALTLNINYYFFTCKPDKYRYTFTYANTRNHTPLLSCQLVQLMSCFPISHLVLCDSPGGLTHYRRCERWE